MTTNVLEIPLQPATPVGMLIYMGSLHVGLRVYWVEAEGFPGDDSGFKEGGWYLDVFDDSGSPIVCGVPLVTGENIFKQYAYLGLPPTWVTTDGDPYAPPTWDNLGLLSHVYFVVVT